MPEWITFYDAQRLEIDPTHDWRLVAVNGTPSPGWNTYSQLVGEVSAPGYPAGGVAVSGETVTPLGALKTFSANNTAIATTGSMTYTHVVLRDATDDVLYAYYDDARTINNGNATYDLSTIVRYAAAFRGYLAPTKDTIATDIANAITFGLPVYLDGVDWTAPASPYNVNGDLHIIGDGATRFVGTGSEHVFNHTGGNITVENVEFNNVDSAWRPWIGASGDMQITYKNCKFIGCQDPFQSGSLNLGAGVANFYFRIEDCEFSGNRFDTYVETGDIKEVLLLNNYCHDGGAQSFIFNGISARGERYIAKGNRWNNYIGNLPTDPDPDIHFALIRYFDYVLIEGNIGTGLYVEVGTVTEDIEAFRFQECKKVIFQNNVMHDCGISEGCITQKKCDEFTIKDNIFSLSDSYYTYNSAHSGAATDTNTAFTGITLDEGKNEITGNTFINFQTAIGCTGAVKNTEDNTIKDNRFIDCVPQVSETHGIVDLEGGRWVLRNNEVIRNNLAKAAPHIAFNFRNADSVDQEGDVGTAADTFILAPQAGVYFRSHTRINTVDGAPDHWLRAGDTWTCSNVDVSCECDAVLTKALQFGNTGGYGWNSFRLRYKGTVETTALSVTALEISTAAQQVLTSKFTGVGADAANTQVIDLTQRSRTDSNPFVLELAPVIGTADNYGPTPFANNSDIRLVASANEVQYRLRSVATAVRWTYDIDVVGVLA